MDSKNLYNEYQDRKESDNDGEWAEEDD